MTASSFVFLAILDDELIEIPFPPKKTNDNDEDIPVTSNNDTSNALGSSKPNSLQNLVTEENSFTIQWQDPLLLKGSGNDVKYSLMRWDDDNYQWTNEGIGKVSIDPELGSLKFITNQIGIFSLLKVKLLLCRIVFD